MSDLKTPRHLPMWADCSSSIDCWFAWADCPAPGSYTGAMLANTANKRVALKDVRPTDIIIYGPGTGWHTAIVIEGGPDPLTISHGREAGPALCRVSQDGRKPQTYLRPVTDDGKVAMVKLATAGQSFVAGMSWSPNVGAPGDWLVYKGRKAGIPNGAELLAIQAHAIPKHVLSGAQLNALVTMRWGKL